MQTKNKVNVYIAISVYIYIYIYIYIYVCGCVCVCVCVCYVSYQIYWNIVFTIQLTAHTATAAMRCEWLTWMNDG